MVDLDLHLQGRSVHFRSNLTQKKTDQDRLIAGPRGIPSGTVVPAIIFTVIYRGSKLEKRLA